VASAIHLGWPNRITIGRMLLIGPFVVCLLNQDEPGREWLRWVAIGMFALMAISDFLDGYLARRLDDLSDLGKFLDPLADKLLITTAVVILCTTGVRLPDADDGVMRLPNWVAVATIGKDLIVCVGFCVILLVTGKPHIETRLLGKLCTAVQLVLVLAMLVAADMPTGFLRWPEILWVVATVLAAAAALDYLRQGTRHLARFAASEEIEN
jgi:CDP-diacylglycerol--glycerol-3-phosphate 3-phosphatidyltransferase